MDRTPHPRIKEILDRVEAKMKARGDSKRQAAATIGVSYQQFWDWMNHTKGNPKPESLDKLEAYCALPDQRETVEFK